MKLWHFSHNNCPAIVLELPDHADERAAVRAGLDRIGMLTTDHPVRAWQVVQNDNPPEPVKTEDK